MPWNRITGMLKKLALHGWVDYEPYQGVSLTESGRMIALGVIRRHRLLETYLVQVLKVPWERVHAEAERMEHTLSEYMEERIDEALGRPQFDPHGAPIPSVNGQVKNIERLRLSDLAAGEHGLIPGIEITVVSIETIDGLVTLQTPSGTCTLGQTSANQVFIKKLPVKTSE